MIPLNSNLASLKRSPIRLYTNLARQTPDCVLLTIGEPDFNTPEPVKAAAIAALQTNQTHYAPNQGTLCAGPWPNLKQTGATPRRKIRCSSPSARATLCLPPCLAF